MQWPLALYQSIDYKSLHICRYPTPIINRLIINPAYMQVPLPYNQSID